MSVCYIEEGTRKIFLDEITYAQYMALSSSDQMRYSPAYKTTMNRVHPELMMYSLSNYTNLDYYGECGTQGSAALSSSSVVDAAFQAELRRRERAPLAASGR